ncbi:PREDICTED: uncharacterized protein LOC106751250 [Dinoponera quadriceps]|uniref:Uncharacterized protein LOC106751250 n=1 Tax=Dinoponera quadriceps TaxID=609295 RepID=A0A6P3YB68_DINQU|nr:PREDICTED: uncharacterized protein LOC106751250 [Dinoponera quadriceps]
MKSSMRKNSQFFLALIVLCQFTLLHAGPSVPVVIWCPNNQSDIVNPTQLNVASDPLQKLSSEDFERTLDQLGKNIDLLIVVDELCVEDFKNNKVLSNAINGSKLYYLPCVDTPYSIFRKTITYKQMKMIEDINDDHELNMVLKDIDSNTCVALTGKECRYSHNDRIKRDVPADKKNYTDFRLKTDRVLLYSSKALLFKVKKSENETLLHSSNVTTASTRTDELGTVILTMKFSDTAIGDLTLEFFFPVETIGYYTLKKVNFKTNDISDSLETKLDIYFPYNFSYHCSQNVVFLNDTIYLNITDMQVQIDSRNAMFSDAYDCVGFTSIPIWTGIFVTAILASIMTWALTMIMDIRTMDRFDDPKGKTITISAAD